MEGVGWRVLAVGCWVEGVGCRVLGVGCWVEGTRNGFLAILCRRLGGREDTIRECGLNLLQEDYTLDAEPAALGPASYALDLPPILTRHSMTRRETR
jgi:hypothetical protein